MREVMMGSNMEKEKIVTVYAGGAVYNVEEAKYDLEEFIYILQGYLKDGYTSVVGLSGNYRGAQYVGLRDIDALIDEEELY